VGVKGLQLFTALIDREERIILDQIVEVST
jgi:hypothetical protein